MIAASRYRYIKYDPDFQANVMDVASDNNYLLPSWEHRVVLNKRMKDLKNNGKFQTADTITNFALNNPALWQFSLIDWKKQGNIYTIHGGMVYTAYGWEGNGVDGYINTHFNPAVGTNNYTLNNAAFGGLVYKTPSSTSINYLCSAGGSNNNIIRLASTTGQRINSGSNNINTAVSFSGTGQKYLIRTSETSVTGVNGEIESIRTLNSTIINNNNQHILNGAGTFSDAGVSDFMMGAFTPAMVQADRIVRNEYLVRMNLAPIL